jgi:3(or 17)beta-hydroxysteroid dehydrogenase
LARVEGKTVVVSGGASGIGAATCRALAREGASVVVADRDRAKGTAVAADIGADAMFASLDVTDEAGWQKVVADTVKRFGALHGLVNAAGIGGPGTIEDASLEDWRRYYAVNATGTFLGCKHAVLAMKPTDGKPDTSGKRGSIVNISSILGLRGGGHATPYSASKGAVRLLTKHVAIHCGQLRYGIRCNSVHPGYIETPMIRYRLETNVEGMGGREYLEGLHPIGRLGQPQEIAELILFLISDDSSFCTGAEFVADGGVTA